MIVGVPWVLLNLLFWGIFAYMIRFLGAKDQEQRRAFWLKIESLSLREEERPVVRLCVQEYTRTLILMGDYAFMEKDRKEQEAKEAKQRPNMRKQLPPWARSNEACLRPVLTNCCDCCCPLLQTPRAHAHTQTWVRHCPPSACPCSTGSASSAGFLP